AMDIGRYLDFTHISGSGEDYAARIHTDGSTDDELYINSSKIIVASDYTTSHASTLTSDTLPNGLIIKTGLKSGGGAVTFATAFPTACVSVACQGRDDIQVGGDYGRIALVGAPSQTGFSIEQAFTDDFHWIAVGY
ncbi:MAG: gp53-like domain-containing protein, partial [Rickettsiales bacterium]